MTMVCHHLNPAMPEDVAFAESRIRRADHRRRGRAARSRRDLDARLRQPGHGPHRRGDLPDLAARLQDEGAARPRCRRTTGLRRQRAHQALHRQIHHQRRAHLRHRRDHIGSLETGKLADIVLWRPAFFGIKPELVFKGGFIAWGAMGDARASLMTCEPLPDAPAMGRLRPGAGRRSRRCFVHPLAIERDSPARLGLAKTLLPVSGTREADEARHAAQRRLPEHHASIRETFDVYVDGVLATCEPAHGAAAGATLHAEVTHADRSEQRQAAASRWRRAVGIGGPVGSGKTALDRGADPRASASRRRARRRDQRSRHQGGRRAHARARA